MLPKKSLPAMWYLTLPLLHAAVAHPDVAVDRATDQNFIRLSFVDVCASSELVSDIDGLKLSKIARWPF